MKLIKTNWPHEYVWVYGPENQFQKFCGGILEAMQFGKTNLKISNEELIYGVSDCIQNNNDVIEFGDFNGIFLFSRKGRSA